MDRESICHRLIDPKAIGRSPNNLSTEFCSALVNVFKARLTALLPLIDLDLLAKINKKISPCRVYIEYLCRVFSLVSSREETVLYTYLVEAVALLSLIQYYETSVDNTVVYSELELEYVTGYEPPNENWLPMPSSSSNSSDDGGFMIMAARARRRARQRARAWGRPR